MMQKWVGYVHCAKCIILFFLNYSQCCFLAFYQQIYICFASAADNWNTYSTLEGDYEHDKESPTVGRKCLALF